MELLMQASSATCFLPKTSNFSKRASKTQASSLIPAKGGSFLRPFSTQKKLFVEVKGRKLVVAEANKKKNNKKKKDDSHSFIPKPDETTGPFPEALLLKEKQVQEDGRLVPEFADAEEEALYEFLNLQMESDLNIERMRHYELVYLIHENFVEEVGSVKAKIEEFMKEKKAKIWRLNDWGLRRLAYKIKKAKNAYYVLMNFELEAKWINAFKSLLDKDERVIRHLVIKRDKAITEDCPPPPEYHTLRANSTLDDEEDMDYDDAYDDDNEDEFDGEDWGDEDELDVVGYGDDIEEEDLVFIGDEDDEGTDSKKGETHVSEGKKRAYA